MPDFRPLIETLKLLKNKSVKSIPKTKKELNKSIQNTKKELNRITNTGIQTTKNILNNVKLAKDLSIDSLAKKLKATKEEVVRALEWGVKNHPERVAGGVIGTSTAYVFWDLYNKSKNKKQSVQQEQKEEQPEETITISSGSGFIDNPKEGQVKPININLEELRKARELLKKKQENLLSIVEKYKQVETAYTKATEKYTKALTEVLPATMLYASKTVLNTLADEDLPEKIREAIEYLPASALDKGVHKVILGYTVARANGMDTTNLSMFDLMAMAENPDLAVNVPQEVLQTASMFGATVGNVYKAKIGQYKYIKDIIDTEKQSLAVDLEAEYRNYKTILDELNMKFNIEKTNRALELDKEKLDLMKQKEETTNILNQYYIGAKQDI